MKKFVCFWALTLLVVSALFASSVSLQWNPSPDLPDAKVAGYNIYAGAASRSYTYVYNLPNVTNYVMPLEGNFQTYYIAATAYSDEAVESDYSDELVYPNPFFNTNTVPVTNTPPVTNSPPVTNLPPVNVTYIGAMLDYGTNLAFLSHQLVFIDSFSAPNLYRLSLILTNKPLVGQVPNDGNSYRYLVSRLDYGTNLAFLNSEYTALMTRTNAPGNELYRASLVITNKPFGLIGSSSPLITDGLVVFHPFTFGETYYRDKTANPQTTEPYGSNDLTVVAWIKGGTNFGSQGIFGKFDSSVSHQYFIMSTYFGRLGSAIQGAFGAPTSGTVVTNVVDGSWHHIGTVYSGTNALVYLDGNQIDSYLIVRPLNIGSDFVAGSGGVEALWPSYSGTIGSVSIYSRALSSNEISILAAPKKP